VTVIPARSVREANKSTQVEWSSLNQRSEKQGGEREHKNTKAVLSNFTPWDNKKLFVIPTGGESHFCHIFFMAFILEIYLILTTLVSENVVVSIMSLSYMNGFSVM